MHTAYIGMGGNVASRAGEPAATLSAAARRMETLGKVVRRSSLYRTEPMGFADQPCFVNAVIALETELEPRTLLGRLMEIEQEFGRDRSAGIRNGPRTLDLDILLFGDRTVHEADLEIPHPRLADRAFVLVPLAEIAANVKLPGAQTVSQLLRSLFPVPQDEGHAAVKIQHPGWRSGADDGSVVAGDP